MSDRGAPIFCGSWQWRGIIPKRAAIYVRVSTDRQTIENQVRELRQIAERRGWQVVEQYSDAALELADYVYVLEKGRIVDVGEPADVRQGGLVSAYLGS